MRRVCSKKTRSQWCAPPAVVHSAGSGALRSQERDQHNHYLQRHSDSMVATHASINMTHPLQVLAHSQRAWMLTHWRYTGIVARKASLASSDTWGPSGLLGDDALNLWGKMLGVL